jgi:transposase
VLSRGDLTDDEWAVLEPLLPRSNSRCGRWRDHRQVISGIIHRLGTGWHRLPMASTARPLRPVATIHKRHMLWSADGTWERPLQHGQAVGDARGGIDWNINIDSSSIRAHQHAAGAPTTPAARASKGGTHRPVQVHVHTRRNPSLTLVVHHTKHSIVPAVGSPPRST